MTEEFLSYFVANSVQHISDPAKLLLSFDNDEQEGPQR